MNDILQKSSKKLSKKEARRIVSEKIATALAEYRSNVKEKNFETNLKKASKLFAADIAKAIGKQRQKIKKPTKIKAVKHTSTAPQENGSEAIV